RYAVIPTAPITTCASRAATAGALPTTPAATYRSPWLNDGKRLVAVADCRRRGGAGEPVDGAGHADGAARCADIGRAFALKVSPTADAVLLAKHRNEILHVDLANSALSVVDRSEHRPVGGFDADGNWAATMPQPTALQALVA